MNPLFEFTSRMRKRPFHLLHPNRSWFSRTGKEGRRFGFPAIERIPYPFRTQSQEVTHHVIVARLPVDERDRLPQLSAQWLERGYVLEVLEKGGLFAMKGRVLDSRTLLAGVFKTSDEEEAKTIRNHLESTYGIRAGVHSELTRLP